MKNQIKQTNRNWIFLILTIALLAIISLIDFPIAIKIILDFWQIFKQILPILIFVFIAMFLLNIFIKPKIIAKHLSKESGIKGWFIAIVSGIISMGPIYAWYPLLADLKEKGTSNALITAFIYSKAIKIQLLPMLIYYFGWVFTIILTFYMIIFSIINGLIVERLNSLKKQT